MPYTHINILQKFEIIGSHQLNGSSDDERERESAIAFSLMSYINFDWFSLIYCANYVQHHSNKFHERTQFCTWIFNRISAIFRQTHRHMSLLHRAGGEEKEKRWFFWWKNKWMIDITYDIYFGLFAHDLFIESHICWTCTHENRQSNVFPSNFCSGIET